MKQIIIAMCLCTLTMTACSSSKSSTASRPAKETKNADGSVNSTTSPGTKVYREPIRK